MSLTTRHLQLLAASWRDFDCWQGAFGAGLPDIELHQAPRNCRRVVSGSCRQDADGRRHIRVIVGPGATVSDAEATLLHELVHAAGWWRHDRGFYARLRRAAADCCGIEDLPIEHRPVGSVDIELRRLLARTRRVAAVPPLVRRAAA